MEDWMQKSSRYESIAKEMLTQDYNTASVTLSREVRDPQDLQEFYDWIWAKSLTRRLEVLTAEEFVRQVDSMSFHSIKAREKLSDPMDTIVIPIGFDGPFIYRLVTFVSHLMSHLWGDVTAEQARLSESLMGPGFLGVNLTVNPRESSYDEPGNLSETSTRSVESADASADEPGFPFIQLGDLEYGERENGRQGPWEDGDEKQLSKLWAENSYGWRETGYGLVARLNPSGYADGIYIMMYDIDGKILLKYANYPDDYDDWDKEVTVITHSSRCLPITSHHGHGGRGRFWFAKLAPNLSSCGKDYQIVLTEKTEHPVELVRAKRSEDGRIVRNTSDKKIWPSATREESSTEESST
ncbi:predicted protein [Chaetomium globosum CBS 148.51]|uniref:Uncharacterized protein n=1 Tax=Chaetomium globosum (strain ATCC 6205 / CBS 148.51 / DSM 1962 / NBRC 6347 / NRRL 1970) TaxID=306901 RepID=Q2HHD0_CHAGB|nr:uncharacterized protein CHGG_00374 [Chaetomium globosum CBS 148.51]EAQ92139.1 predicted protein [Chaetomium globosum CBS 148.51]